MKSAALSVLLMLNVLLTEGNSATPTITQRSDPTSQKVQGVSTTAKPKLSTNKATDPAVTNESVHSTTKSPTNTTQSSIQDRHGIKGNRTSEGNNTTTTDPAVTNESVPSTTKSPTNTTQSSIQENRDTAGGEGGEGKNVQVKQSGKKMLWILLPVLGVLCGAVMFGLKSKLARGHGRPDATDNGMENASFQSRPESTKDGVMLLGVKSSAGDDGGGR